MNAAITFITIGFAAASAPCTPTPAAYAEVAAAATTPSPTVYEEVAADTVIAGNPYEAPVTVGPVADDYVAPTPAPTVYEEEAGAGEEGKAPCPKDDGDAYMAPAPAPSVYEEVVAADAGAEDAAANEYHSGASSQAVALASLIVPAIMYLF